MSEKFRQDMPPPGGYRAFNWNRTYPKVFWKRKFKSAYEFKNQIFSRNYFWIKSWHMRLWLFLQFEGFSKTKSVGVKL